MSETTVHCNCAQIPPTMPTARTEHLVDCPVAIYTALQDKERMRADHAEIAELMKNDDHEGLARFLNRNVKERARAAFLRSRAPSLPPAGTEGTT